MSTYFVQTSHDRVAILWHDSGQLTGVLECDHMHQSMINLLTYKVYMYDQLLYNEEEYYKTWMMFEDIGMADSNVYFLSVPSLYPWTLIL